MTLNKQSGTDKPLCLSSSSTWMWAWPGGQFYVQWWTDRRTSPPNPNTDCLHPAAAQTASPGSGGQLTKHLLTAHTASAQLKLRFSKQDAAAWEGENSTSDLLSELFLKNTSLVKMMSLCMTESYLYMGNNVSELTGLDLNAVRAVRPEL